jgi:hypothetical protein
MYVKEWHKFVMKNRLTMFQDTSLGLREHLPAEVNISLRLIKHQSVDIGGDE